MPLNINILCRGFGFTVEANDIESNPYDFRSGATFPDGFLPCWDVRSTPWETIVIGS